MLCDVQVKYYHINISSQIEMSMSFATMCQRVDSMLLIFGKQLHKIFCSCKKYFAIENIAF